MEIEKLADVIEWADSIIRDAGFNEEKYKNDALTAYCHVKAHELWKIRDAVLKGMEIHSVYTNALNQDIVAKDAKIELMQKELDGRKAGYVALKARMDNVKKELEDTKEALDKTIESWVPLDAHDKVVDDLKDAIKERDNKIVELEKELAGRKKAFNDLNEEMATRYIAIETHNDICKTYENRVSELEKESEKWQDLAKMNRDTICNQYDVCEEFKKKIAELEEKVKHQKENLDGINKTLEIRTKENERLIAVKNNQQKEIEAHESENARLSEKIVELKKQVEYLKKELNQTCTCKELDLKGHQYRETALVNSLADKNDEIKKLKEEIEELHGSIHRLTLNCRSKNTEIARLAKEHSDIRHELAKRVAESEFNKEDDHGRAGFKRYIEYLIEEEERAVPERFKERLNEEITEIFEKEEETEVNDIPCGEDAIE